MMMKTRKSTSEYFHFETEKYILSLKTATGQHQKSIYPIYPIELQLASIGLIEIFYQICQFDNS